MFHPCRLLVFLTLVFVSLLASSPAFATRDTPEDEKSLTIRNESAEEPLHCGQPGQLCPSRPPARR